MKILFSLLAMLLFVLHLSNAQSTPVPPKTPNTVIAQNNTTSHSSSKTEIEVNIDRDQKLKISIDDKNFDLSVRFDKMNINMLSDLLSKYLGNPKVKTSNLKEWRDTDGSYRIRLKGNRLEMDVNKAELSTGQWESFIGFASDVLVELGFEVDLKK